ncbi:MAG TPA: glycerol-3-phosphate acyltransferase [Candidatus Polarisedimenticolia bacterium]|nr:glycerol-3-phosphate acyltransferase [Candidatus Polarisedimenticolia bacterium]
MNPAAAPLFVWLLAVLIGFLIGSLPCSLWVGRFAGGIDVRRTGSRNPGATNVWRSVGRLYGILAGLADAGKGALAVAAAWALGCPDDLAIWAGAAAVAGHDFSPWLGFRGGKGGATTLGCLACFIFPELLVVLTLWVLGLLLPRRHRFLWSLVAVSTAPLLAAASGRFAVPYLGGLPARSPSILAAGFLLMALLWVRVTPGLRQPHA